MEFSVTAYKFFTRYKISYNMSRPFKRPSSSTSKELSREDTQLKYMLLARSVKRVGTIACTHIDSLIRRKLVSSHLMLLTYVVVFRCLARITTRYPLNVSMYPLLRILRGTIYIKSEFFVSNVDT